MNILALTSSYPRFEGDPTAPFVESITRHLALRGHTVHLVLPQNKKWRRPSTEGGVHYHPYRYSPRRTWTPWGYSESLEGGVRIKRSLYALAPAVAASALWTCGRVLSRGEFDLVHAHWVIPNGPIGALVARRHRLPLVVSLHGSDISLSQRSEWVGRLTRSTFAHTAAVTAPSRDLLERATRLGAKGTLEPIPYGADVSAFAPDPEAAQRVRDRFGLGPHHTVVAGVGRLIPVKGFDYLVEAHARASATHPELRLILVGDGDAREELTERARLLGVADTVTFAGTAARDEVPAYLAASDVVVVPSVHYGGYVDGLPNVALEAMAAGKPLVATRVGGLPDLVHPENGVLVDERDIDGLADAIVTLSRDRELRTRLGDRGRALIRDSMSWEIVAERFESVFERVARRD
jgi:glycosyltransferase involved in cell wall biosynthesis